MYSQLRENIPHGTEEYPYTQYHIQNILRIFQVPVHWHPEMEIIYVNSASLTVSISGETFTGTKGSIFVVNPGELHFMGSDDPRADYYTLLFPLDFLANQSNDWMNTHLFTPLSSGQKAIQHELPQNFIPLVTQLITTNEPNSKKSDLNIKNGCQKYFDTRILLFTFFKELFENDCILLQSNTPQKNLDKEILTYLQQNFQAPVTLSELAMTFHLSEKYLSRYFKEHFQLTFTQYLRHLRLTKATQLLQTTSLAITDIALQCGFANVSHFIRTFKDTYGVSPLKYRHQQL